MIRILNRDLKPVAILENAFKVSYQKPFNQLWKASFLLPLDDPKNNECAAFNFVEIKDHLNDDEYIGLFRIVPKLTVRDESNNTIKYSLQHVIGTLLDSVLFRYHETTNLTTRDNIQYILDRQNTKHWVLGTCDITRYFHYKFENENGLLGPLFSIPQPFDEEYQWTYDTTVYPFVLNLVKPNSEIQCEIRYGKNQKGIEREEINKIVNRLYPLGYGEGVNQLGIESVNNGVPYLEDAESIANHGLMEYVWPDTKFEDPQALKASGAALLKKWANPIPSYRVSAADVSSITKEDVDKLRSGRIARVVDPDFGTFNLRIVNERKSDVFGSPGVIDLEIGSLTEDIATVQADLERKMQVNEAYSQGATNIDTYSYNDNADADNPAVIRFYLPEELVNINKLELAYEVEEFRAYSKATKGGGSTVQSTSSGGASTQTSSSGGASTQTSSSGGGVSTSTQSGGGTATTSSFVDFSGGSRETEQIILGTTYENHTHTIYWGSSLNHDHTVSIPAHSHSFSTPNHSHTVETPAHTHSLNIPAHTHDITLPDHTHDILYGIYRESSSPSSVAVKVDGNPVSDEGKRINIIPFLAKDDAGRVLRGQWHEVTITPDGLGRINANIFGQYFLQSRGGTIA